MLGIFRLRNSQETATAESKIVKPEPKELYVPRQELREELQELMSHFRQKRSKDPLAALYQWQREMAVNQILISADQEEVETIHIQTGDSEVLPFNTEAIDQLIALTKHSFLRAVHYGKKNNSHFLRAFEGRKNASILECHLRDESYVNAHYIAAGNAYALTHQAPFIDENASLDYDHIGMRYTFNDPEGAQKLHDNLIQSRKVIQSVQTE